MTYVTFIKQIITYFECILALRSDAIGFAL